MQKVNINLKQVAITIFSLQPIKLQALEPLVRLDPYNLLKFEVSYSIAS